MQNPSPSVWIVLIDPVLITCTLPRKEKKLSSDTHQIEHVQLGPSLCSIRIYLGDTGKGENQRREDQTSFFTQCGGLTS
ncbi:unnamed protein product [Staurois parvus]|uniref:Uncharacterized protein n=1 Tax=Staurois parvus TaxID=386267 RepID=A0ABN9EDG6_9NEOB|nr:unnamed protein product [Staurois parvus]